MTKMFKGLLAMQFAVAGVAVAQNADQNQAMPYEPNPTVQQRQTQTTTQNKDNDGGMFSDMTSKQQAPAGTVRASTLIGTEVYNRQDKHLGEINDIVLDHDGKKVGYVVLSYGGMLGMGDKLFAMPIDMIDHTPGQDKAYVELEEQVLKNAPGFDKNNWPSEANASYYKQLDQYYEGKAENRAEQAEAKLDHQSDQAKAQVDQSAQQAGERLDQAGNKAEHADPAVAEPGKEARRDSNYVGDKLIQGGEEVGDAAQAAMKDDDSEVKSDKKADEQQVARPAGAEMGRFDGELQWNRRVSDLLGSNVENTQGENLGEINDLVLDLDKGEVRYAVLSHGGVLGLGDKLFAVPMDVFQTKADEEQLILDVPQDKLKNAPGFDRNQWPNMADPQWSKSVDDHYRQFEPASQQKDQPKID